MLMRRGVKEMAEDRFEKLGPMLGAIGEQAADDLGGNPEGIYIYAEAGDGWYSVGLFRDEGDAVRYYRPSLDLSHLIRDEWQAEDPEKRWCVMEYEILGNRFDTRFKFPDEVDVENLDDDRRASALRKRYGDRQIVFPPWEDPR